MDVCVSVYVSALLYIAWEVFYDIYVEEDGIEQLDAS